MKKSKNAPLAYVGLLVATLMLSVGCSTTEASKQSSSPSQGQLADTVMKWWNGDYDNEAQIAELRADGVPIWKEGQHEGENPQMFGGFLPVHSHYRNVSLPAFGKRVIYLEELTFKDNPYRQRIYTVIYDEEKDSVRVKLWYFKDKKKYLGAWQDLTKIQDLTPTDMSPLPDFCDLHVRLTPEGRLEMKMPKEQCKFGASIFDYQVSLGADDFWFRDRIVDAETMTVKMTAGSFSYHKLDKSKSHQ